jgi:kynurenine formamidase
MTALGKNNPGSAEKINMVMDLVSMKTTVIDLTQTLNGDISVYPGTAAPAFDVINTIEKDGFAERKLTMTSHSGTHIDAPSHIFKNAKSLDQFPPDKFIGKAILIHCEDKEEISLNYIKTFEDKIARVDFILFYTGWQHKWKTKGYFGDCPTLTGEAAKWLTRFNLKGIGFDSFSSDSVVSSESANSETLPIHNILLQNEVLLIENLTNLDKLPGSVFTFQCLPLKIENADGSPVRAIAVVNE